MTADERHDAAMVLAEHARETGVDFSMDKVARWRESVESLRATGLDADAGAGRRSGGQVNLGGQVGRVLRKAVPLNSLLLRGKAVALRPGYAGLSATGRTFDFPSIDRMIK